MINVLEFPFFYKKKPFLRCFSYSFFLLKVYISFEIRPPLKIVVKKRFFFRMMGVYFWENNFEVFKKERF